MQNPVEGVDYYNGRADDERNILLDSIESREKLYVHDLAGDLLADLTRIVDDREGLDGLLDAFEAHGYRLALFTLLRRLSSGGLIALLSTNFANPARFLRAWLARYTVWRGRR